MCDIDRKILPLAEVDLRQLPDDEIVQLLEEDARRCGIARSTYRVLDFGCGRGEAAGRLRNSGWDAYGVDIEQSYLDNGAPVLNSLAAPFPVTSLLHNGRSIFPDSYFDAVVSDQTLEHVRDLHSVAREIGRVLRTGGITFHRFPSQHSLVETHCRLPLIHWLPKSSLRRVVIRLLSVFLPVRPIFGKSDPESIYRFTCEHTFYRSWSELRGTFGCYGISLDHYTAQSRWAERKMAKYRLPTRVARSQLLTWMLFTFVHCRTVGRKIA